MAEGGASLPRPGPVGVNSTGPREIPRPVDVPLRAPAPPAQAPDRSRRTAGPQPRDVPRLVLQIARLGRRGHSPATSCGSFFRLLASDGGAPAPRRPAARSSDCSPRTAGPQPRDVLRLVLQIARLGRRGPSPATSCGSFFRLLASDGGAPAPRRPAARSSDCSPRTAGPQPRDVLRLVLQIARLGRRGPSPATSCGSFFRLLASDGGAPAPRRPAARSSDCSPRTAG